jgi:lysophospholipase L1-like esterase
MKYGILVVFGCVLIGGYFLFVNESPTVTNMSSSGTRIVAFGDSLVEGVGATEGNDFVHLLSVAIDKPIINLGSSGDTTRDALARIDSVLEQDPKIVLVLFGGNDYLQKIPEAETFANLEQIIQAIHESGSAVVLLGVRGGIFRDNFKEKFTALAEKHNTAYVSDVLDGLLGNRQLMADSVHPNDAGHRVIADRILPELEALLEEG